MNKAGFTSVLLLMAATISFCQTESFDIVSYTPPASFKKTEKQGVLVFSIVNNATGGFCIISVYAGSTSSGTPATDFKNEWKDLAVGQYHAAANPTTETQTTPDGWASIAAASAAKNDGVESFIVLTIFSGFGKTVSVLANLNDQSYVQVLDNFLATIRLDKKSVQAKPKPSTNHTSTNAVVVGRWGKSGSYLGAYSNDLATNLAFSGYTKGEYIFHSDGSYRFQGEVWGGQMNSTLYRLRNNKEYGLTDEIGSYHVEGSQFIITPSKNIFRVVEANGNLLRSENPGLAKRTYKWQTYYAVGMEETRLVLTAPKENVIDGAFSSFEPAVSFPNSFCYALNKNMFFKFLPLDLVAQPSVNKQLTGTWGKSSSSPTAYTNGALTNLAYSGYTKGEYNFRTDGSYTFQGESWGGYLNSTEYRLIDEKGSYKVTGNQLNITPTKSIYRVVDRDGNLKKSESLSLAKRSYTWRTHYYEGIQETNLVLTATKENVVDGHFTSTELFPRSYLYSPGKKLEFRFLPLK